MMIFLVPLALTIIKTQSTDIRIYHEPDCAFCMDADSTHYFHPCGHLCVCSACSKIAWKECPICRQPVKSKWRYEIPITDAKPSIGEEKRSAVRRTKNLIDKTCTTEFTENFRKNISTDFEREYMYAIRCVLEQRHWNENITAYTIIIRSHFEEILPRIFQMSETFLEVTGGMKSLQDRTDQIICFIQAWMVSTRELDMSARQHEVNTLLSVLKFPPHIKGSIETLEGGCKQETNRLLESIKSIARDELRLIVSEKRQT